MYKTLNEISTQRQRKLDGSYTAALALAWDIVVAKLLLVIVSPCYNLYIILYLPSSFCTIVRYRTLLFILYERDLTQRRMNLSEICVTYYHNVDYSFFIVEIVFYHPSKNQSMLTEPDRVKENHILQSNALPLSYRCR